MGKEIVKPTLILFVICAVVTFLLAFVFDTTRPVIAERSAQDKLASLQRVLPGAASFGGEETADDLAAAGVEVPEKVRAVYRGQAGGQPAGLVVEVASRGYSSVVRLLVGVTPEGAVSGVVVLSQSETPGLGSRATDASFLRQFETLRVSETLNLVKGGAAAAEGDIDAVSGATITSRAVTAGVQDAMDIAETLAKEAQ